MAATGGLDLKLMPKLELHAHLTGSISRQCLHEVWLRKQNRNGARDETVLPDPLIEMPLEKYDYDLETYIYELCNDPESIAYSTNSVLQDFHDDGVVYLELRTTPREVKSAGITKDEYVRLVLSCISAFQSTTMTTKLILSIDRRNTVDQAMAVVDLAIKYRHQGVVAVDLCGDPSRGDVSIFQAPFAKAKKHGLKITLHFAEAPQSSTDLELRTLLSYEPDRIGHVINVPQHIKQIIEARKLGLELCLSCNVHAKMITGSYGDHHFAYWRETACPITICTDDVGVFGSKLSNEYALIAEHFHLSRDEICRLARSGIDSIFSDEEEKSRLKDIMWS